MNKRGSRLLNITREINELNEEVVYWISHKYIRGEINELNEEVVYWDHTSILEGEINELNEEVVYWIFIREGISRGSYLLNITSILEREINELNEEVVYWISHKYIREGNKWTKRGSRLLNITQVY